MGCGKSSVGRELSRLLCCPFMDLDDVIEERNNALDGCFKALVGRKELRINITVHSLFGR